MPYDSSQAMKSLAYNPTVCCSSSNIFLVLKQPKLWLSLSIAIPNAMIAAGLQIYITYLGDPNNKLTDGLINDNAVFKTLTFFVVFLAAFRIDAGYNKFWSGCEYVYEIVGDLFDGTSDLVAFTRESKAPAKEVEDFHHLLIRLISLFNSLIFGELESGADRISMAAEGGEEIRAFSFELLDVQGIDDESIDWLLDADNKVEQVFCWIQMVIVDAMARKLFTVPSPILTRSLSDIGLAVVHFHEAQKITEVPFPFPYMMALQILLVTHWCFVPIVMVDWTTYTSWTFIFAFCNVWALWFFIGLAVELEMPFQHTRNSVDMRYLQKLLNSRLLCLLESHSRPTPHLLPGTSQRKILRSDLKKPEFCKSLAELIAAY
eukprot:CAMPEP_0197655958 /NCGR_PEP_ID=MMETSP1338-20131121/39780_1 /TAXON_ID=43686 ORGANISM="Pelagodinium beii, Strain RCC1491" /NCGR_SAMPLE_ID=MMETSP1338 /ASSEMBLY_ACC=CAM_ASM_000754 /LENGTH=374 /DNA_ID=CAMNT_0043231723 /DNA_START=79 /DNA_END=1203 /DNA_ORIENTATION=-